MKYFYATLLVGLLSILQVGAQTVSNDSIAPFAVVCTYDYSQTLESETNLNSSIDGQQQPLHYLVAKPNADTVTLDETPDFDSMLDRVVKKKNLLVYIHGDNSQLSELLSRGSFFASTYDTDYLLFAWPSNEINNHSIKNYKASKENVTIDLLRFARLMEQLSDYVDRNKIECTVMFHSLGNQFAKQYAHYLINNPFNQKLAVNNIILNAGCVWERDHNIWVDVLVGNIRNQVIITHNDNDVILKSAALFIEGGKLLGEADIKSHSRKAIYVDFTDILKGQVKGQESHGYFLGEVTERIGNIKLFYRMAIHTINHEFESRNVIARRPDSIFNDYVIYAAE